MNVNWNLVIILIASLSFCLIFKSPLSKLFEKISNFSFKRKKKDYETELTFNTKILKNEHINEVDGNVPLKIDSEADELIEDKKEIDEISIYNYLENGDFSNAEISYKKLLSEKTNKNDLLDLELLYLYFSYYFGKDKDLKQLNLLKEKCDKDYEQLGKTLQHIGLLYFRDNEKDLAEQCYTKCYALNISQELLSKICISHSKVLDDDKEKVNFLIDKYSSLTEKAPRFQILFCIYNILKEVKDDRAYNILEKATYDANNNYSNLFDIAYNHNSDEIAALIYGNLIDVKPNHATTLNNLGVVYRNLNLNMTSVNYYKKSFELGSSLAAANIARLLIGAGFKDEAFEYLTKEQKKKEYHENIDHHLSYVHKEIKNENEKKESILKNTKLRIDYMNKNGFLFFKPLDPKDILDKVFAFNDRKIVITKNELKYSMKYSTATKNYLTNLAIANHAFQIKLREDTQYFAGEIKMWISVDAGFNSLDILLSTDDNVYNRELFSNTTS